MASGGARTVPRKTGSPQSERWMEKIKGRSKVNTTGGSTCIGALKQADKEEGQDKQRRRRYRLLKLGSQARL